MNRNASPNHGLDSSAGGAWQCPTCKEWTRQAACPTCSINTVAAINAEPELLAQVQSQFLAPATPAVRDQILELERIAQHIEAMTRGTHLEQFAGPNIERRLSRFVEELQEVRQASREVITALAQMGGETLPGESTPQPDTVGTINRETHVVMPKDKRANVGVEAPRFAQDAPILGGVSTGPAAPPQPAEALVARPVEVIAADWEPNPRLDAAWIEAHERRVTPELMTLQEFVEGQTAQDRALARLAQLQDEVRALQEEMAAEDMHSEGAPPPPERILGGSSSDHPPAPPKKPHLY